MTHLITFINKLNQYFSLFYLFCFILISHFSSGFVFVFYYLLIYYLFHQGFKIFIHVNFLFIFISYKNLIQYFSIYTMAITFKTKNTAITRFRQSNKTNLSSLRCLVASISICQPAGQPASQNELISCIFPKIR